MGNNSIKPLKNSYIYGFVTALLLSAFIYFEHLDLSFSLINGVLGAIGLFFLINAPKKALFFIGFFTSFLWFYWIGLSFRFNDYSSLAYIIPFGVSAAYGALFFLLFYIQNPFIRTLFILYGFNIIEPFGFTWFKFETIFASSIFATDKISLALISIAVIFFSIYRQRSLKLFIPTLLIVASIDFSQTKVAEPDLKIKLVELAIEQETKWADGYRERHAKDAIERVKKAVEEKYELVIVPESAIPLYLNLEAHLLTELKDLSQKIDIVVGSLKYEKNRAYNSTYIFRDGDLLIADKVFLVPFGEASPMTGVIGRWVNDTFFGGAEDFTTAEKPTDFQIKNYTFRNAICYEGSVEAMFLDAPKFMIVISNNAWFAPSIEPTLQKLVMLTWARKHGVKIYHASNKSPSETIN